MQLIIPGGEMILKQSKAALIPKTLGLASLVDIYKGNETVSAARFGLQSVKTALDSYDSEAISQNIELFNQYGIDWAAIIAQLAETNADVTYEQIENVGLDYNLEQFIASIKNKKTRWLFR